MYYHTRAELACSAAKRLNSFEEIITEDESTYTNEGNFSPGDTLKNMNIGEKKIIKYIQYLVGKKQFITVHELSKELNIPEEFIAFVLEKNKLVEV